MAYVQVGDRQYPLVSGENVIGGTEQARIPLPDETGVGATAALIVVDADGGSVIKRTGSMEITVNGVHLGAEPTPLIHGDKIEIGSTELFFGDDRNAGSTRFVAVVERPERASTPAHAFPGGGGARNAAGGGLHGATGGRLVSLVDGREYLVSEGGLILGRDPTCDVVVPVGEVSRKHAVITAGADGYVVTDTSANGLSVNGERVASSRRLARGDVLKVGTEEFRFHADAAPARPVLATLEVKSTGVLQGTSFEIRSGVTHIGRGAHNDVVLADDSVSESHATLQRREDGWYVVDMGSTNGTYIGGRRMFGEARLDGAPDLRIGGIKFIFRPTVAVAGAGTGGGPVAGALLAEAGSGQVGSGAGAGVLDAGGAGAGQTRAIAALTPEQRARLMASAVRTGSVGDATASGAAGAGMGVGVGVSGAGIVRSEMARESEAGAAGRHEVRDRRRPSPLFWIVVIGAVAIAVFLLFF